MRDSDLAVAAEVERVLLIQLYGKTRGNKQIDFNCPVHEDKHPSATYNRAEGVWVCYGCGAHGGLTWGETPLATALGIDANVFVPPATIENVRQWRERLATERAEAESRQREALQAFWRERRLLHELEKHNDVLQRLERDGISALAAEYFGFSWRDYYGLPALAIPWTVKGDLRALQYRLLTDKAKGGRYRWHEGSKPTLFNADAVIQPTDDTILIVEGAKKAACLWGHGITSVCAVPSKGTWSKAYAPPFKHFARVVFVPDPDAVDNAYEWAKDIPGSRIAILPDKPDDFLMAIGGNVDLWWRYIENARKAA